MFPETSQNSMVGSIYLPVGKKLHLQDNCFPETSTKNKAKSGNGSLLVFNIGPSFLHMIYYNNINGRSFNYIYDYCNCTITNDNLLSELSFNECFNTLNTDMNYVLNVNIYKEKYASKKYLSGSFPFYGRQPFILRKELLQILQSEHCKNWNENWIKIILEQMFIIFSCIKDGVIIERLLESACECAKMLLLKSIKTDLLEFKYSYAYFVEMCKNIVKFTEKYLNKKNEEMAIFCGDKIGKVHFDMVDNFSILSFETKEKMDAYTKYENHIIKTKPEYLINLFNERIYQSKCSDLDTEESNENISETLSAESNDLQQDTDVYSLNISSEEKIMCESPSKEYFHHENSTASNLITNLDSNKHESANNGKNIGKLYQNIPIFHGCNKRNNILQSCTCKTFSLGMALNIGKGKQLSKDAVKNLEILSKSENKITYRSAMIAASALANNTINSTKRFVVPVIDSDIVSTVQQWQSNSICTKITERNSINIDKDVEKLINDMLDSICCTKEETEKNIKTKSYPRKISKLVRELNKLSASIFEENDLSNLANNHRFCNDHSKCNNDCDTFRSIIDYQIKNKTNENEEKLKKKVILNNQTLISMNDGKNINITTLSNRSKREIKMSTRFKNSILLDEASLPAITSFYTDRFLIDKTKRKRKLDYTNDDWKKRKNITVSRKLDYSIGNNNNIIKKTLADIFIWCAQHDKYNCPCTTSICRMNNNILLWQPPKTLKYITNKIMSKIDLVPDYSYEVYYFDSQEYCARTYGLPINYTIRNNTEIFSAKRRYELENNIISSTNSYIKMKFLIFKLIDNKINNESNEEIKNVSCLENVQIIPDDESDFVDIMGCSVDSNEVIIISDSDEDVKPVENKNNFKVNRNKTIERKIQQEVSNNNNNNNSSVRTYLKAKKKLFLEEISDKQTDSNQTVNQDKNNDRMKLMGNFENKSNQINTVLCSQNLIDINKFDQTLENCIIRLKDHPLKDEIYDENKLPKLALYCVTPGIGYLPIVEYKPNVLTVQDPIFPELLHSFKNLTTANIWLNKFLKDFLVFGSIDLTLKWIIVKPGIIKIKQSQPFSPAILENSPLIITKEGEIIFGKKEFLAYFNGKRIEQNINNKRKFINNDTVVDIKDSGGKRKKIHLDSFSPSRNSKILTRTVNLVQQYPFKKISSTVVPSCSSSIQTINNNDNSLEYPLKKLVSLSPIVPGTSSLKTINNNDNSLEYPLKKLVSLSPIVPGTSSLKTINNNDNSLEYPLKKLVSLSPIVPGTSSVKTINNNDNSPAYPLKKLVSLSPIVPGTSSVKTINNNDNSLEYPLKKLVSLSPIVPGTSSILLNHLNKSSEEEQNYSMAINNLQNTLNRSEKFITSKKLKFSPTRHYKVIPANLLIPMNVSSNLLKQNKTLSSKEFIKSTKDASSNIVNFDGRSPLITSNRISLNNENSTEILK